MEYSVNGRDYNESGSGIFQSKIVATSKFADYVGNNKNSNYYSGSSSFEKSDDADLFYSLHNYDIEIIKTGVRHTIKINDVYDFEVESYDSNYRNIFGVTINNWAWLCQNANVLQAINVNIIFTY